MYKKITSIILALASASAYAGQPGNQVVPPSGVMLIAPSEPGIWTVGFEAQWMMPLDQFQFMQADLAQPDNSVLYHNESVDNEKDFGIEADVDYRFADSARDVRVAFTDLNMSDDESYSVYSGTPLYGPNGRNNPLNITDGGSVLSTAAYHYRAGDLTFGQLLTIGQRFSLHPFAGLRYAHINLVGDTKFYDDNGTDSRFDSDSTFDGLGPRAGADLAMKLGWGFSLVDTLGSSLLLGNLDESYKVSATTTTNNHIPNTFSAIPELDESLGLDYQYAFTTSTAFDVQGGVQVVNYFNADQHDYLGAVYTNSTLSNANFAYHGVYVRTQLSFA